MSSTTTATTLHNYLVDVWGVGASWVLALDDVWAATSATRCILCITANASARGGDAAGNGEVALTPALLLPFVLKHFGQCAVIRLLVFPVASRVLGAS